ncbi:MAG: Hsp20 family protein [Maricaulaceae bacterium]
MRNYDFSPLYRSFVGLDRMAGLIDAASQQVDANKSYPPYNVVQIGEDAYRIDLAVAGFSEDDIDIESHESVLTVTGHKAPIESDDDMQYLHRGIAERGFERRFQLADHVIIEGADLKNGLLSLSLRRELPDALKPRKIKIGEKSKQSLINSSPSRKGKAA